MAARDAADIPASKALYAIDPWRHPPLSDPVANPELIVDEEYGILLYQLARAGLAGG